MASFNNKLQAISFKRRCLNPTSWQSKFGHFYHKTNDEIRRIPLRYIEKFRELSRLKRWNNADELVVGLKRCISSYDGASVADARTR